MRGPWLERLLELTTDLKSNAYIRAIAEYAVLMVSILYRSRKNQNPAATFYNYKRPDQFKYVVLLPYHVWYCPILTIPVSTVLKSA